MTDNPRLRLDLALRVIVVLAWVSAIALAFPLPTKQIAFLEANVGALRSMVVDEMRRSGEPVTDAVVAQRTEAAVKTERQRLWFQWIGTSSMIVLGLIAAYFAIRAMKGWKVLALVGSLWYVIAFLWNLASGNRSVVDAYSLTVSGVLRSDSALEIARFFHASALLPLIHVLLIVWLITKMKERAS